MTGSPPAPALTQVDADLRLFLVQRLGFELLDEMPQFFTWSLEFCRSGPNAERRRAIVVAAAGSIEWCGDWEPHFATFTGRCRTAALFVELEGLPVLPSTDSIFAEPGANR